MSLVHNSFESLFGGVNQQAAEYRLPTQVEEMINGYPTIDQGLLRRNPMTRKELSATITFDSDIWTYEYDRGFGGDTSEKYAINITVDGIEIINTIDGTVYKDGSGLTFDGNAKEYVFPFIGANGYAATTIKDTTFLVNKNRTPTLLNNDYVSDETPVANNYHYSFTTLVKAPARTWTLAPPSSPTIRELPILPLQKDFAPAKIAVVSYDNNYSSYHGDNSYLSYNGATTLTVIIDGMTIVVTTPASTSDDRFRGDLTPNHYINLNRESLTNYHARVETTIRDALDPNLYSIERADDYNGSATAYPPLRITRWDEAAISSTFTLVLHDPVYTISYVQDLYATLDSVATDYIGAPSYDIWATTYTPPSIDYLDQGFIWIERSEPVSGYTYTYTVIDSLANSVSGSVVNTTSTGAATAIAAAINADANFTATAVGSVVRAVAIASGAVMDRIDAGDSYGNQASFGWAHEVATSDDLPKNLGFSDSKVKVIGTSENAFAAYWLSYSDSQWREIADPNSKVRINSDTMPHTLVRNADNTFTLKAYDAWADKQVGDDVTDKPASFLSTVDDPSPVIKDVFFFKNRLGFITSRTVILSEVGEYGNFWRTTVAALLDSDRIDATVDTTKAIDLEYTTYLEDSVMLFSDIQFRLSGGDILSPKNVQISQTSAYEINRNVRPVFMNDRVFFCVKRGGHTAVMEYFVSESASAKSEANDITAHCQTYIPQDVIKLTGSSINNMLFLIAPSTPETLYVYKYYDHGRERIQSAWFKWTYNGEIVNAFSFGRLLNMMIKRKSSIAVEDWVVATGIWEGDKLWKGDQIWIGDPSELSIVDQFEQSQIAPLDFLTTTFIDDDREEEDKTVIVGFNVDGNYASAEVLSREDFTIYTTDIIDFVFSQDVTAGSLTYTVHRDDATTYSAVTVDNTPVTISVPKDISRYIDKITVTPEYGVTTTIAFNLVEAFATGTTDNLLQHLGVYGWYVDDTPMPSNPLIDNQGAWFKLYGVSNIGALIPTQIDLGEWVLSRGGQKEIRGHLQFKTAQISSEEGSQFSLKIGDIQRNTERTVNSNYTVGRKPMIYGNAKNIRLSVISMSEVGFRINTVSYEGNFNIRSRRN